MAEPIAASSEEVLTHGRGVSLFRKLQVEPAEAGFMETTLMELAGDVSTCVGGSSLFRELDLEMSCRAGYDTVARQCLNLLPGSSKVLFVRGHAVTPHYNCLYKRITRCVSCLVKCRNGGEVDLVQDKTELMASAYDPLDPSGNITISWDFLNIKDTYSVSVSLQNYQLYRHLEDPGWRLSWFWAGDEVILEAKGAEATEQGNCSRFVDAHSCEKRPVLMDLGPGTPYNRQVANCCRGGVLSSLGQNSMSSTSAFMMIVGNYASSSDGSPQMPFNFSIGVPGYTCSNATVVPPSRTQIDRQRHIQALMTWQVSCSYSQTVAGPRKSCCVSLSSFYSDVIVECPRCICGACPVTSLAPQCKGPKAEPSVRCTGHMCPIRVHWHVKKSYREYWRVKMTVNNFNTLNYSDWNLVVQHPGMQNLTQVFSFNHHPLVQYGAINDTELFWGLPNFNKMLLQDGNVQTEILLRKNEDFTFDAGWAFPRKIYFDGGECAMPPPDDYPQLPSTSCDQRPSAVTRSLLAGLVLLFLLF